MLVSLVITMTIKDNQIVFDRVYPKSVLLFYNFNNPKDSTAITFNTSQSRVQL